MADKNFTGGKEVAMPQDTDFYFHACNALAVLEAGQVKALSDAAAGLVTLAKSAHRAAGIAKDKPTEENLEKASCLYAQTIAVCSAINVDTLDSELFHAGQYLMEVAKNNIDARLSRKLHS